VFIADQNKGLHGVIQAKKRDWLSKIFSGRQGFGGNVGLASAQR